MLPIDATQHNLFKRNAVAQLNYVRKRFTDESCYSHVMCGLGTGHLNIGITLSVVRIIYVFPHDVFKNECSECKGCLFEELIC